MMRKIAKLFLVAGLTLEGASANDCPKSLTMDQVSKLFSPADRYRIIVGNFVLQLYDSYQPGKQYAHYAPDLNKKIQGDEMKLQQEIDQVGVLTCRYQYQYQDEALLPKALQKEHIFDANLIQYR